MAILPYRESKNTLNIPCAGAAEGSCQSLSGIGKTVV